MLRKGSELWHSILIFHGDSAPHHETLSAKQFLSQKLITEMEQPPCSHDLASNYFVSISKNKVCLKWTTISGY
jgi:hypothetical protein